MTGHRCCVCGNTKTSDPSVSFHRVPKEADKRALWLEVFSLREEDIKPSTRVCSRHFPDGDASKSPNVTLGKRFASPIKQGPRAKRAKEREEQRMLKEHSMTPASASSSRSVTPAAGTSAKIHTVMVGEQLQSDYLVHELPGSSSLQASSNESLLVDRALLARIEMLEAENSRLQKKSEKHYFRVEDIQRDDRLVRFYTGFVSYALFLAFFEFLGPAVNHLIYWGSKEGTRQRHRVRKLDPKNQLFLALVKLRLNLKLTDLAFRFGLSASQTSRYLTTWICFLYRQLKEIDWMPAVDQVFETLPSAFKEKFPKTYAIIDGSEVFIETPSDLHMQSSTWSQYKHHNTVKFLVACTPNGAICFISPVYVGSISDVELTRVGGFLTALEDKPGVSIMADRGFTIKDMLKTLNIDLNIPPFLDGQQQLPPEEIQSGRRIASLRIHVERAIGRIKVYSILKGTIPLSMARLTNQIIFVCAFLTNFQPVLIPLPTDPDDKDIESYFDQLSDCDSDVTDSDVDSDNVDT